jgi:GLPGLI family protein
MKSLFFVLCNLYMFSVTIKAQNPSFISKGIIEFERKINLYKLHQNNYDVLDLYKKNNEQFRKDYFALTFTEFYSLYKKNKDNPINNKYPTIPAEANVVFTDLVKGVRNCEKVINDKTFLIFDTLKPVRWKITNEKRMIAGFECRRANAVLLDSIYVVAFFSEELLSNSGPESFSGLPGVILGVAIPQQYITWFATKVSLTGYKTTIEKPLSDKGISNIEFKDFLLNNLNGYGDLKSWYFKFSLF